MVYQIQGVPQFHIAGSKWDAEIDIPFITQYCWSHLAHYETTDTGEIIWVNLSIAMYPMQRKP